MAMTERPVAEAISRFSWGLVGRGVVGILFGLVLLVWPGLSLRTLVLVFGAYAFADGCVALWTALTGGAGGQRWWLLLHGIGGIGLGVVTLLWTGLTALALLYLIGSWAIVLGAMEIGEALTSQLPGGDRVLAGLNGFLRIGFGLVMWWRPGAGAIALITLVAAFAVVVGVALVVAGFGVRSRGKELAGVLSRGPLGARS